jgi:hypothetical protein
MALKFRRGTTAQQSGSLAFGEPYVNTTLGTLLIGGPTGDIVLSTTGTGSTGTFGAISGSGLDITGNANIAGNLTLGGNITIGDATTDNVVINADLSSSLIPNDDNAFDIGSTSKRYRNIYGNQISGSQLLIQSGSNPQIRLINNTTGIEYHIQNGDGGNLTIHNSNTNKLAAVFPSSSNHPDLILYSSLSVSQSISANSITSVHINGTLSGSFSGSINGIGNVTTYSSSVASKFTTLGTYTASVDGRFTTLATLTGSNSTRLTALEASASTALSTNNTQATSITNLNTTTASLNTSVSNLNTFSASENGKAATLATYTGSVEGRFATLATLTGSNGARLTALEVSASTALSTNNTQATSITNLNSTTASLNTSVTNLNTFSASENGKAATLATYTGSNDTKWSTLGSLSGSFARTNSANIFTGNQTISGSLYITQNLIVQGSSSIQNISSSQLNIGTNIVQMATSLPSVRYAGWSVVDSGSSGVSASMLWDSQTDEFIFTHTTSGSGILDSSMFIYGPLNTGSLDNIAGITPNRLTKGESTNNHGHHITSSQISDDGTTVTIPGALTVTGNITGPIRATNGVVSGSSQITYASISSIPAGIVSGSSQITSILPAGVVSGSSQVTLQSTTGFTAYNTALATITGSLILSASTDASKFTTLATYTGSVEGRFTTLATLTGSNSTRLTALETSASTALSTNNTQATSITNLNTLTASALTRLTALEVETANLETFSASALTRLSTLEGKDISITLTGDVTGTGTITDLANVSFATTIAANSVALGTDTTGNYVASMTAGTGITVGTATGEGSTPVITNTGVTSAVAGTGVSVNAGTGAVTFSIGQAVATSSSPTFAGLTINGAITATGDITAFFTSDKRHKNTIQNIPNALEKVSKLNGVTWEWNEDVNEVTKSTPKTGLIAQEVQEVLPEVVREREDGFLSLDYSKMVGLLVEAIKEQQSQIEELKSKLGYN